MTYQEEYLLNQIYGILVCAVILFVLVYVAYRVYLKEKREGLVVR